MIKERALFLVGGFVKIVKKGAGTFWKIKKNEVAFSVYMFTYFFLIITSFWILKTLKKGVFFKYYEEHAKFSMFSFDFSAAQAELVAKFLNMIGAIGVVLFFSYLSTRLRREKLTYVFTLLVMGLFLIFSYTLRTPGEITAWSFYIFGDLFSTVMVATFFAYLNDSVIPETAKRLYGPIGLGGLAGGAFGTTLVSLNIEAVSLSFWMLICLGISCALLVIAYLASRDIPREQNEQKPPEVCTVTKPVSRKDYTGLTLVLKSPYLFSIMMIVGLYEIVSSLLDFQFSSTMEYFFTGETISGKFAQVFAISNWIAFFVQLFFTSFVMTRFGITTALLFLPAAVVASSVSFMVYPVPIVASMLNAADNGFSYSINQSAKEVLYVPADPEEKYRGKAFIDMFIQRFAKTLAIILSLTITAVFTSFSTIRWISIFTLIIVIIWINRAIYAGKFFSNVVNE